MHPIFFSIGKLTVYSYGFFVALGFFVASIYLSNKIKKSKEKLLSQDEFYSFFVYEMIFVLIGLRLFYVLTNLQEFTTTPFDVFKVWQGGLTYYGGFISGLIFLIIYAKKKHLPLLKLLDFFGPSLPLGHAIGRIGCFLAGCCYGKETNVPWSVVFTDKNSSAVLGVHVHPTQLYESFGNFLIFIFLHFYSKKNPQKGQVIAVYFISYAILRFIVEFFRNDPDRGSQYFGLSISQIVSICLFIIGVFIVCKNKKKK
ncbi:MAG: prolipoprotein diacylglyceryl transferase [Endomicrobium sp.]|jgi:phosphatidylglycerol:prolipoprotein diacylglycerol transferase|nr:prolipoprotein diacylglyceryl transferase [Endomicrobium sp.]